MTSPTTIYLLIIGFGVCQGVGLFAPEEVTQLLQILFTRIPPVRTGTDSRVGLGFRLGRNADFQVLLELGPQENTAPLGPRVRNGPGARRELDTNTIDTEDVEEVTDKVLKRRSEVPFHPADLIQHLRQLYTDRKNKETLSSNYIS